MCLGFPGFQGSGQVHELYVGYGDSFFVQASIALNFTSIVIAYIVILMLLIFVDVRCKPEWEYRVRFIDLEYLVTDGRMRIGTRLHIRSLLCLSEYANLCGSVLSNGLSWALSILGYSANTDIKLPDQWYCGLQIRPEYAISDSNDSFGQFLSTSLLFVPVCGCGN